MKHRWVNLPASIFGKHPWKQKTLIGVPDMDRSWKWAVLITVIGLVLRLYQLGTESLWIDEGFSIQYARDFDFSRIQDVRPLYFAFLHFWMYLGHSEFFLRLPAALFGACAVPVMYLFGKRIVSERAGLAASALLAVSPFQIDHSQEIRMYSLVTLLTLLAMYQFCLFLLRRKTKHLAWYILLTMLDIATFPSTVFLLVVQNMAAFVYLKRREFCWWSGAQLATCVVCAPMLIHTLRSARGLSPELQGSLSMLGIVELMGRFTLFSNGLPGSLSWFLFFTYTFAVLGLIVFGLLQAKKLRGEQLDRHIFLVLWLLIPLTLTAEAVRLTGAQWLSRYLIYVSPAFYLLLGSAVDLLPRRTLKFIGMAAILLYPMVKLDFYYTQTTRPQWREAVRYVERNAKSEDVIALYRPGNGDVFRYYYHGNMPWCEIGWPKLQKKRPWTERRAVKVIGEIPTRHDRVWLLMSMHEPEGAIAIERYIRGNYTVLDRRSFEQIEMILFRWPISPPSGS